MKAYLNLYRSGFYHREGKPGVTNVHAGDLYLSREKALADVHPSTHYLCTVEVDCPLLVAENPADSLPIPLSVSRKAFFRAQQPQASTEVIHG